MMFFEEESEGCSMTSKPLPWAVMNDVLAMDAIESQIFESQNLMYSI